MNRCPITYEPCGDSRYSLKGLHRLNRRLDDLKPLPYTQEEQLREAAARADKMSIQGVQPKLGATLNVRNRSLDLVDRGGLFILKPQIPQYSHVPENEDLTMRLAATCGIETPLHFLVRTIDDTWTYCIRRFDRTGDGAKLLVEDFSQLTGATRDTKYDSSMERVASVIEKFCTFPAVEKSRLLMLTLFSFLTGNEDMHLKNLSLITREGKITLSLAYDLVSSSIVVRNPREQLALPLRGKKSRLTRADLIDYYAQERLGLPPKAVHATLARLQAALPRWTDLIKISFLPEPLKSSYLHILTDRCSQLAISSLS